MILVNKEEGFLIVIIICVSVYSVEGVEGWLHGALYKWCRGVKRVEKLCYVVGYIKSFGILKSHL